MKRLFRSTLLLSLCAAPSSLRADVRPSALFTDHAVLQRAKPIPVWGTADPGENVTVNFAQTMMTTKANKTGHWHVDLPAQEASSVGRPLTLRGHNEVVLHDILIGEVWLAGGQSNMEWPLKHTQDGSLDTLTATSFPNIRHFKVTRQVARTPEDSVDSETGWEVASPESVGRFTAVGYYFAREVHLATGVPVGIINSTWGGTNIESWISPESFADDPAAPGAFSYWEKAIAAFPENKIRYDEAIADWETQRDATVARGERFKTPRPWYPHDRDNQQHPSNLYNAMVHGLAPVALQGVIWYQGESNASRSTLYRSLFPNLIRDWRATFNDEDLDFFWVQLASYGLNGAPDDRTWAQLREVQTATLALPCTGEAVIIDIGDHHNIHPHNKLTVGRRLARLALHRTYGLEVIDQGPTLQEARPERDGLLITYESVGTGLFSPTRELTGFEIAGEDHDFYPANAELNDDNSVFVRSDAVRKPVAVRYAWTNAPAASLFNSEGLPAAPFRTDNW